MRFRIAFLHGLESGPHGSKFQMLSKLGLGEVIAPDCEGIEDPDQRLAKIREVLKDEPYLVLVGSSFGGLMALRYAKKWPMHVAGLVLCAPAVHRPEWPAPPPIRGLPTRVLHGSRDEVVPLAAVQRWARYRNTVTVVDDDHRLANSHEQLADMVRETLHYLLPPYRVKNRDLSAPDGPHSPRHRWTWVYDRGPDVERWLPINRTDTPQSPVSLQRVRATVLLGKCYLRVTRTEVARQHTESYNLLFAADDDRPDLPLTIAVPSTEFPVVSGNWVAVAWLKRDLQVEPVREFAPGMLAHKTADGWQRAMAPIVDVAREFVGLLRDRSVFQWPAGWFVSRPNACARCAKELTDAVSQSRGVGPDCFEDLMLIPWLRGLASVLNGGTGDELTADLISGIEYLMQMGLVGARPPHPDDQFEERRLEERRRELYAVADRAWWQNYFAEQKKAEKAKRKREKAEAEAKAKAKRQRAAKKAAKTRAKNAKAAARAARAAVKADDHPQPAATPTLPTAKKKQAASQPTGAKAPARQKNPAGAAEAQSTDKAPRPRKKVSADKPTPAGKKAQPGKGGAPAKASKAATKVAPGARARKP